LIGARAGAQRAAAIKKYQGSAETEKAVICGVAVAESESTAGWFVEMRAPRNEAGTSLAVLAFLGHGETPDSLDYGATVQKALQYLVSKLEFAGTNPSQIDQYAPVASESGRLTVTEKRQTPPATCRPRSRRRALPRTIRC